MKRALKINKLPICFFLLFTFLNGCAGTKKLSALFSSFPTSKGKSTAQDSYGHFQRLLTLEKDFGSTVQVSKNESIQIELEGNPTTGYLWEVSEINPQILEKVKEPEFKAQSNLTGAPGKFLFHFKPISEGKSSLVLIYRRPWEKEVDPEKTFKTTILVR